MWRPQPVSTGFLSDKLKGLVVKFEGRRTNRQYLPSSRLLAFVVGCQSPNANRSYRSMLENGAPRSEFYIAGDIIVAKVSSEIVLGSLNAVF